jgi:hypothetical protein
MTTSYPIIEERLLDPTPRRGMFGMGRQVRDGAQLPKPAAHQVLVYRVAGEFVLDPARLGRSDAEVVNATNVSVVDMRRDVEVAVQLPIPSGEASEFTVVVTFVCCVTDAVTVVRDGQSDAQAVLHAYLRGHRKIFELGLDHHMAEINEVRRMVNAQVTAYTTIKPPLIAGMSATLASVEVLTPQELAEFEKTRRGQRESHTLRREQQDYEHRLLVEQRLGDQQLGKIGQQHDHDLQIRQHKQDMLVAADRQRFEQMMSAERQKSAHELEAQRRTFARQEAAEAAALLHSYDDVLRLAYASGEVDATKLAELLQADRDHAEGLRRAELERTREDEDRRRQEEREDLLLQCGWEREDRAAEREAERQDRQWQREQELRMAEERRRDAQQQKLWTREDALRREVAEREEKQRRLDVSLNMLREVANHGHLDMVSVNVERLIAEILPPVEGLAAPDERAEIETGRVLEHDGDQAQDAADLREEDDDPS